MKYHWTVLAMFIGSVPLAGSGCVSSTLESSQFRAVGAQDATTSAGTDAVPAGGPASSAAGPVDLTQDASVQSQLQGATVAFEQAGVAQQESDGSVPDPAARERAVAEMRAKAAAGSGQKTQFGVLPETATQALTAQEQAALSRDLSQTASQDVVSDEELAAKKRSIEQMRRKARVHYKDALNRIER